MSGTTNAQKRFHGRDLHEFGDKKTQDWLQRTPKSVPCTVTAVEYPFVTVQVNMNAAPFTLPKIKVPQSQSAYFREPTQVGDQGFLEIADYYLGGVSGLGGGVADLTPRGNLSTGVYRPITRASFSPMVDPNKAQVQGPEGVVIQDDGGHCVITVTPTTITIVDESGNEVVMKSGELCLVPAPGGTVYLGGDPAVEGSYAYVDTVSGPSINTKARYA